MDKDTPPENNGLQQNKRMNLRAPILTLRVKLDDGQKAFFGYAKNISASGMFIASINPKEPGEAYEVEIPLPAPIFKTVQCTCVVVWRRQFEKKCPYEPGMGLKFVDIPDDVAHDIDRWVHENHPEK
ncbi:MAG: pilus assembly protein PilZ [Desulfuromonas sp.]|nr:MAG: pilus assembly protein PilZ [Desulfuromonas sp.]